jgi:FAD/FMN-containing dehydrogenase/Fe-S oxidoreductase
MATLELPLPASLPSPEARAEPLEKEALERDLRAAVRGEVGFDDGSRALYATDASNYRQVPLGVVFPRDEDDVVAAVAACRRHGAPVVSRGGGTALAGQTCNAAVVLDFSRHVNHLLDLHPEARRARVQPGLVLDDLRRQAERHHLTFGPDPATHNHNTLGGMIGNNSCGSHSVMAGKTVENVETLDVLTYDGLRMTVGATSEAELSRIVAEGGRRGQIYARLRSLRDRYADLIRARYPKIPRRVSGYNLDQLLPENGFHVARALVGTEGTCVTVLEATLRLVHSPPVRHIAVLGFRDVFTAAEAVPFILREQRPIALEGFDETLVGDVRKKGMYPEYLRLLPEGKGYLVVEYGGDSDEAARGQLERLRDELERRGDGPAVRVYEDRTSQEHVWKVREAGLGATAIVPGEQDAWPGWEDAAVAPERLAGYLRDFRALLDEFGYHAALYGHFGDGCVHCRITFDLRTTEGLSRYRAFVGRAAELVVRYGGSMSGEHGDGQSRAELLPVMFGAELTGAFAEFKRIWDPEGKMNPGKVTGAYPITSNLRLRLPVAGPREPTHFQFPDDGGSFERAVTRCVGVGKCRREDEGLMCPSYMVTRDEKHTTRGRAHLLWEMLRGGAVQGGYEDEAVKESLHLCLSCKGCKGECPINVDMATYKAEFLAHYHEHKPRPRWAYSMGLIDVWARLGARVPWLANLVTQTKGLASLAKWAGGIAPERRFPPFAPETFQRWYARRGPRVRGDKRVILWPDTFNNHFHPDTAKAAVEVLEAAGYTVHVPRGALCCGRPLYDFGMLDRAKRYLQRVMDALSGAIDDGVPIVGLEPSCVSVFRDELRNLFPHDARAKKLAESVLLLAELLDRDGWKPPRLAREVMVQGHCHQQALMKMDAEARVLERAGLSVEVLDAGCCGMAGSFGFERERDKYEVSVKLGERRLVPAVKRAPGETLVLADGFSCREQIAQSTERRALHLAEVLAMALREGPEGPPGALPERHYVPARERSFTLQKAAWPEERNSPALRRRDARVLATVAGVGLGVAAALSIYSRAARR